MSISTSNLYDSLSLAHSKFQSLENDLSLVEQKLKNELRCVYDFEVFDISETVSNIKLKVSNLNQSLKDLFSEKKSLFKVIDSQLKVLGSLSKFEELKDSIFTDDTKDILEFANEVKEKCVTKLGISEELETSELFNGDKLIGNKEKQGKRKIEFIPINEAQFNTVPVLVRRRATLSQVNELLEHLYNEATKRNRCVPISINDISNKGIKVHGQTGSSKIAILRFLKMVDVNNRENTVLLLDKRFKISNYRNRI